MTAPRVRAFLLVYNADWSVRGGLEYLAERLRGSEPCELCRITYGDSVRKRGAWRQCERALIAPVREVYRNQAAPEVAAACDGRYPAVLAETDQGVLLLVGAEAMLALDGSPQRLHEAVQAAAEDLGLTA